MRLIHFKRPDINEINNALEEFDSMLKEYENDDEQKGMFNKNKGLKFHFISRLNKYYSKDNSFIIYF